MDWIDLNRIIACDTQPIGMCSLRFTPADPGSSTLRAIQLDLPALHFTQHQYSFIALADKQQCVSMIDDCTASVQSFDTEFSKTSGIVIASSNQIHRRFKSQNQQYRAQPITLVSFPRRISGCSCRALIAQTTHHRQNIQHSANGQISNY